MSNRIIPGVSGSSRSSSSVNLDSSVPSSRSTEADKWYFDLIEQYKDDPEAYAYLSANPYLVGNNAAFSPNLGQSFLSLFGDNSAEDSYYAELKQKAFGYLSDWRKQMYEQKYDSPVEQVARMSAAGINSALEPSSISSGEAAENDQAFSPTTMPGAGQGAHLAGELAGYGLQFISGIFAFGKQIQDFNIGSFQKIGLELGASNAAQDYVLNQLAGISDSDILNSPDNVIKNLDFSSYSRSTRKFLTRYFKRFSSDVEKPDNLALATRLAKMRREMLSANRDSASIMSSPYYSKDLDKWTSSVMDNFSKYVAAAEKFSAANSSIRSEVENVFLSDVNNQNILGENMAEGVNSELLSNKSTAEAAKYKAEMERTWNELEQAVKGDGNHWYNTIGLILLNFLRAQVSDPLHLGVSNTESKNGASSLSSFSWHF